MHFLIWETLSFNLIYVAACYPVGTGMCHNMVGLLQHYNPFMPNGILYLFQFKKYIFIFMGARYVFRIIWN